MFLRLKRSGHGASAHEYVQVVESVRDGSRVRQRLVASLGRLDRLVESGAIDSLAQGLARFSETLLVLSAAKQEGVQACRALTWGPALVFQRLWEQQGLPEIIAELAATRRYEFDVERTSFALALQRLCQPGSDLQGSSWVRTVEARGLDAIQLQYLYRTVAFLSQNREELERSLFYRDRDLFNLDLDLVFIDTTSTYVYRTEQTPLLRRGYSRDHRPDLPQIVLCVAVNQVGWPIAWEVLPGNTSDHKAFANVIARFRERFAIRRTTVVADRGMLSKRAIQMLEDDARAPFEYVLGCRMRRHREVSEDVLSRAGRYHEVTDNLKVKEVYVSGRRYIVCLNEEEARRDAAAREAILPKLEETLAKLGPKTVIGNKAFSRFVHIARGSVTINREAVEADARLDGKFVLRTNTELSPAEVALSYKSLWRVERTFREQKSTLEVRPIYHHRDETVVGHIVGSFLALRLEVDLHRRLEERGVQVSWPDLMRDLGQLQCINITVDGATFRVRTDLAGIAHTAFVAAGVRPPPRIERASM